VGEGVLETVLGEGEACNGGRTMNPDDLLREIAEVNEEWKQEQHAKEEKRISRVWDAFVVVVIIAALVVLFWLAKGGA